MVKLTALSIVAFVLSLFVVQASAQTTTPTPTPTETTVTSTPTPTRDTTATPTPTGGVTVPSGAPATGFGPGQ